MYQRNKATIFRKYGRKAFFLSSSLIAASLCGSNADAQWTNEKSYLFQQNDVKHYATAALAGTDQYIMAGTLFEPNLFDNSVHWMYIDNAGNTSMSKVIDDPGYDERVMGVHYLNVNEALIVATHFDAYSWGNGNDGIEILRVDGSGNLLPSSTIINGTTPGWENLYPLGSLQYNNQYLFICGYATPIGSNMPSLRTTKKAFVLKYDMIADQVVDMRLINNGGPAPAPYDYDFDMAARMKVVSTGIWVGGSINKGPMLNRIINPNTMADLYARDLGATPPDPYHFESSYDIMDQANTGFMVFGNNLAVVEMPGVWNAWATPYPQQMHVTAVTPGLIGYPGNNRWLFRKFDYAWGVNTVPGRDASSIIISGMASNRTCNGTYTTSTGNVNPFLTEIRPFMVGNNISVFTFFWNTILSNEGTGSPSSILNYMDLGYPVSNLIHTPITTVRDITATNDIMLTSPVWNSYAGHLGMKWIRTDANGELNNCAWAPACEDDQTYTQVRSTPSPPSTPGGAVATYYSFNSYPFRADYEYVCSDYFKPTGIVAPEKQVIASVSPNPASEYIHLVLSNGGVDEQLRVRLTDISGKDITTLYSGKSKMLPERLNLPKLAQGIYLLQVESGVGKVKVLKLSIR
jgi:hypothetical protein